MRTERRPLFGFLFRLLWRISVVWAVVSGFAHLPVIYRYAEAALPWLRPAAYSGTVAHYWAAAAMLCLTSYAAIVWLVRGSRSYSLTPFGMLRLVLLALLMLSGLGLILHNFQDFSFYGPVYTLIKHGHLGCALLWALLVLVRLARRGLWWDRRPVPELVSHAPRHGPPSFRITKKDALRASFSFVRLSCRTFVFLRPEGRWEGIKRGSQRCDDLSICLPKLSPEKRV